MNKRVIIIGGGTVNHVRAHLAISAVSYGTTAKQLYAMCKEKFTNMDVELVLTKMADSTSKIETNYDLGVYVDSLINDNTVKCIFFNAAVADFHGAVDYTHSSKYAARLKTKDGLQTILLHPAEKIIGKIRKYRKDIFLVGFKATTNADEEQQVIEGLDMLKRNSVNIVLANDLVTRSNMLITPEEGVYSSFPSRQAALSKLVDMAYYRSHLTFTRSTVIDGAPVEWQDSRIPANLRVIINWCVSEGAYKVFNGATTGHFAAKLESDTFLTSIRKTNFNDIDKNGMVLVKTDGNDNVIAYGAKPSVGGQSQRLIFEKYPDLNCIVHFHCPLKSEHKDDIPTVSQLEYECGSHQCGENTANGLKQFGDIFAVMLDKHGPNIVFYDKLDPAIVIQFIKDNFDLSLPTNGFSKVYLQLK